MPVRAVRGRWADLIDALHRLVVDDKAQRTTDDGLHCDHRLLTVVRTAPGSDQLGLPGRPPPAPRPPARLGHLQRSACAAVYGAFSRE